MEQMLLNLLYNAVKFNRLGGEVKIEIIRPAEDKVGIVIADSGIGIPSESLSRIFERFIAWTRHARASWWNRPGALHC